MSSDSASKRPHGGSQTFSEHPAKRPRYSQETIVAVLVGPEKEHFAVRKDVLCSKSRFFRAACSQHWREGQEKAITLPEIEPTVFQVYVDWLYTKVLTSENIPGSGTAERPSTRGMVNLYLLGDVLDDVAFRNAAMQLLYTHSETTKNQPSGPTIARIWENTPEKSLLRKWVLDVTVLRLSRESFAEEAANYPAEFVLQLASKLMREVKLTPKQLTARLSDYLEREVGESE